MKKYEITKEQIIELALKSDKASIWLQQNFNDAFKLELETGKWYKSLKPNGYVFEYIGDKKARGFFQGNDWTDSWCWPNSNDLIEADKREVFELLKKEAMKRYKKGDYLKNHHGTWELKELNIVYSEKYNNGIYNKQDSGKWLFLNGEWAEKIRTKTKEQAEKELNCKIID